MKGPSRLLIEFITLTGLLDAKVAYLFLKTNTAAILAAAAITTITPTTHPAISADLPVFFSVCG